MLVLTDQGSKETWFAVYPGQQDLVITDLGKAGFGDSILGDSATQLEIFQNDLVFREVSTAFELNALVLIPLSVVGFSLIQLFASQRRLSEFSVLQAIGLSKYQGYSLFILDGIIFVALGLLIGFGIGVGLSTLMQPFLAQILPPLGGSFVLTQMTINWVEIGLRFSILTALYGLGLLALIITTTRRYQSVQF
jgi:ABC-type antimicrobial peptide transport system permease subunit